MLSQFQRQLGIVLSSLTPNPTNGEWMSNQTEWVVKYKLPGDQVRTPREIVVRATTQSDAKKVAQAMIPSATILGGPQQVR